LHLFVYLLEYMKMHGPGNIKFMHKVVQTEVLITELNCTSQRQCKKSFITRLRTVNIYPALFVFQQPLRTWLFTLVIGKRCNLEGTVCLSETSTLLLKGISPWYLLCECLQVVPFLQGTKHVGIASKISKILQTEGMLKTSLQHTNRSIPWNYMTLQLRTHSHTVAVKR
jgi:hypothetical protein